MRFACWDPDNGDEADAKPVDASSAGLAAEVFVERRWADFDYTEETRVHVRDPERVLTKWIVTAEKTVDFRARNIETGARR